MQILICEMKIFNLFLFLTGIHHWHIFHLDILSIKKETTYYPEFYQNFYHLVIWAACIGWHYLLNEYRCYQTFWDHNLSLKISHSSPYTNTLSMDSTMLLLPILLNQIFYWILITDFLYIFKQPMIFLSMQVIHYYFMNSYRKLKAHLDFIYKGFQYINKYLRNY